LPLTAFFDISFYSEFVWLLATHSSAGALPSFLSILFLSRKIETECRIWTKNWFTFHSVSC